VLDMLADHAFLREAELKLTFQLSEVQVKRILEELHKEGLVHVEHVVERGRTKAMRELEETERAGLAGTVVAMSKEDAEALAAEKRPRAAREMQISDACWYINPRWFVDEIRFRIACMNELLSRREQLGGTEKALRCPKCSAEYSMLEAQQHRAGSVLAASRRMAAGLLVPSKNTLSGLLDPPDTGKPSTSVESAATRAQFLCANDGMALERIPGLVLGREAAQQTAKWHSQLQETGIPALLKELESVPLGSNRPTDHIRSNRVTLRQSRARAGRGADMATSGSLVSAAFGTQKGRATGSGYRVGTGVGTGAKGAWRPSVFQLAEKTVEVDFGGAAGSGALEAAAAAALGADEGTSELVKAMSRAADARGGGLRESAEESAQRALPSHLQTSAVTGEASTVLGFVRVGSRGVDRSVRRAQLAAQAEAVFSSSSDEEEEPPRRDTSSKAAIKTMPAATVQLEPLGGVADEWEDADDDDDDQG
jgi:transcription initiation factor IIE alpha subunit